MIKPSSPAAYELFHEGLLTLAEMERNGLRIDTEYLDKKIEETKFQIQELEEKLKSDKVFRKWARRYKEKTNLGSRDQLSQLVFTELGYTPKGVTATGRIRADKDALDGIDLPFVKDYLVLEKLKKMLSTNLIGIKREVCDGFLHPFFNANTVSTFRLCVAKGTCIEVVRDVSKYPKGIKIEEVKVGDFVYSYDDNLNLTVKKVLWTGKTGKKKVIRLHWTARGKKGYLDVTPDHLIRMRSGRYVKAKDIVPGVSDFRKKWQSRHAPKTQVLAMGRVRDRIFQTGVKDHILDHRLVYECLVGKLKSGEVVHHKDHNHLNNDPKNLERMTKSSHASHHENFTDEGRKKAHENRIAHIKQGLVYFPSGEDHFRHLSFGKFTLLRMLAEAKGQLTKIPHDFQTIKDKISDFGIDVQNVKDRYDRNGRYISKGRLFRACKKGRDYARLKFGVNFYKLKKLMEERGLDHTRRKWANQFGPFAPNNHKIVRVEYLDNPVDVYDIEVEDTHNFIANEICVHNSSSMPNSQNLPIRDKLVGPTVRGMFVPRDGCATVEIDYGALEFKGAANFWKDPNMVDYADNHDVHRTCAAKLFLCSPDQVTKDARYLAKNRFVFPILYGSYYRKCAMNLWRGIGDMNLTLVDGTPMFDHLKKQGVKKLGLCDTKERPVKGTFEYKTQEAENWFNGMFPKFMNGKDPWWNLYCRRGWFEMQTGFVCSGVFSRNFLQNAPIQGSGSHCLLWSANELRKHIKKYKRKWYPSGTIHDSLLVDVPVKEIKDFLPIMGKIMRKDIKKHWEWILTEMIVEADVVMPGENWGQKKPWIEKPDGGWVAKNS